MQTQQGNIVRCNRRHLMKIPSRPLTTQSNSHVPVPPTLSPPMFKLQFNLQPNILARVKIFQVLNNRVSAKSQLRSKIRFPLVVLKESLDVQLD